MLPKFLALKYYNINVKVGTFAVVKMSLNN